MPSHTIDQRKNNFDSSYLVFYMMGFTCHPIKYLHQKSQQPPGIDIFHVLAQPREIKSKRKGKDQWRYEIYHSPPGATKARRGKMTRRQNQLDKQTSNLYDNYLLLGIWCNILISSMWQKICGIQEEMNNEVRESFYI